MFKLYASSHSRDTEATAPWWDLKIHIFYNAKVILILGMKYPFEMLCLLACQQSPHVST